MDVQVMLHEMGKKAFDQEFFDWIAQSYQIEPMPQVPGLEECEDFFRENKRYASKFGFCCGIYAGFGQLFDDTAAPDAGYDQLVCKGLFKDSWLQQHHAFYSRHLECQRIESILLEKACEAEREQILDAMCIGDDWVYGAALYGFYYGYLAAQRIIVTANPGAADKLTEKRIITEHYLGIS